MNLFSRGIIFRISLMLTMFVGLSSCSGMIYDDQGDCQPYYKVRFVYDTNLKFTDAFPAEVSAVTLYLVDPQTDRVVWRKTESGESLASGSYMMDVDVEPGRYTLLAWCGEGHQTSFRVNDAETVRGLQCRLHDRKPASGMLSEGSHVDSELKRLFHGLEYDVEFEKEQGVHIKTVRLIKDTNDLHIVLQHLSGNSLNHEDFTFTISGDNGLMDWDNSLLADEPLTYFAHSSYSGFAGVDVPDYTEPQSRYVTQVSAAVAHISTSRLTKNGNLKVNIYNKKGERIVSVPLIDYALLVRSHYKRPDGTPLTDQEYLDYQDDYSMVFFLDDQGRWMDSYIYINSWRVILQNADI
ncbi:MAG: FimB/Mfa2 family fimbrial subunit [Muribaculaceae bacterium]|nr:FimB/Mfa2 family fimbrial subunit [Muribaculaceae bacterium]MDE6332771.1 FimB/Mfa2 family fimbrial subunit [Muribaculaceae bacterium]